MVIKLGFLLVCVFMFGSSVMASTHYEREKLSVGACEITQDFKVEKDTYDIPGDVYTERKYLQIEVKSFGKAVYSARFEDLYDNKASKAFSVFLNLVKKNKCSKFNELEGSKVNFKVSSCELRVRRELQDDHFDAIPYLVNTQVLVSSAGRFTLPSSKLAPKDFVELFKSINESGLCILKPIETCHYGVMEDGTLSLPGKRYSNALEVNGTVVDTYNGGEDSKIQRAAAILTKGGLCASSRKVNCEFINNRRDLRCPQIRTFGRSL